MGIRQEENGKRSTLRAQYGRSITEMSRVLSHCAKPAYVWGPFHQMHADDGSIVLLSATACDKLSILERSFHGLSIIYTVAQRTADWFTLRHFRLTATLGGKVLLRHAPIHNYYARNRPTPLPLMGDELMNMAFT